ncbi:hypothetical protein DPV73_19315 [Leptospira mayottensis]|nr:hypothetical protein DPV73_19315 [Leptospira mayottensis]
MNTNSTKYLRMIFLKLWIFLFTYLKESSKSEYIKRKFKHKTTGRLFFRSINTNVIRHFEKGF